MLKHFTRIRTQQRSILTTLKKNATAATTTTTNVYATTATPNKTLVQQQLRQFSSCHILLNNNPTTNAATPVTATTPVAPQAVPTATNTTTTVTTTAQPQQQVEEINFDALRDESIEKVDSFFDTLLNFVSPAHWFEVGITTLHDVTGIPWWACIAGVTFTVRCLMFPVYVLSARNSARFAAIQPQITSIQKKQMGLTGPVDQVTRMHLETERRELLKKHDVQMWKLFAPMLQAPVFIGFFIALRRMAANVESFTTGGFAWFTDLSLADPFWILPVLSTVMVLTSFELGLRLGANPQLSSSRVPSNIMKYIQWGMRVFLVAVLPFVGKFPTALFCYWIPSNLFQVFQVILLRTPVFMKKLKIPEVAQPSAKQQLLSAQQPNFLEKVITTVAPSQSAQFNAQRTAGIKVYSQKELTEMKK